MTLAARHLSVRLRPKQATLDKVSLSVQPGEILAVVGQNGAGKSTLLKVLSGELAPDSGEIQLMDRALADWPDHLRARLLAVLPQQHNLSFDFLVEDVVALGRYPHQTGRRHDNTLVTEAMALCDLLALRQRTISTLSGGEHQRVHLARVLVQIWEAQPEGHRFLLLDEPTTGLDLHHQQALFQAVQTLANRGVGVLLVVHDLNLAARHANRIQVLHQGRSVAFGRPAEVLTAATIAQYFELKVSVQPHPLYDCPLIISH
ncbi:MAG: heme ABC transporter ATP-binding protein [Saccharospirillum sp.]